MRLAWRQDGKNHSTGTHWQGSLRRLNRSQNRPAQKSGLIPENRRQRTETGAAPVATQDRKHIEEAQRQGDFFVGAAA